MIYKLWTCKYCTAGNVEKALYIVSETADNGYLMWQIRVDYKLMTTQTIRVNLILDIK